MRVVTGLQCTLHSLSLSLLLPCQLSQSQIRVIGTGIQLIVLTQAGTYNHPDMTLRCMSAWLSPFYICNISQYIYLITFLPFIFLCSF